MHRKNNFSFIHLFAALLVMYGHEFNLMGQAAPTILNMDCHGLGVRIIFVISGYLITMSYIRSKNAGQYMVKRIIRIFPPLITCIFVMTYWVGPIISRYGLHDYLSLSKNYFIKNVLLYPVYDLPGVFENNIYPTAVNGSLWTMPIEFVCYILLIFLMKVYYLLEKKRKTFAQIYYILLFIVCWVGYVLRITGTYSNALVIWGTDWLNAIQVAAYFMAGSLVANLKLEKYCYLQVAIVLMVVCKCLGGYILVVMYLPLITYATIAFAQDTPPLFCHVWAQEWSYGIYLWSFPIQQIIIQYIIINRHMSVPIGLMYFISVIITFVFAGVSYRMVEKPLKTINLIRKKRGL